MERVAQLGYIGIGVSNPDAWKKQATEVLGFEVIPGDDKQTFYLRMDEYHHRVEVHNDGKDDLEFIGWEVPDAASLQAIAQQLENGGVQVTYGTREEADERRVRELIKFTDPAGIPSEVFYGRPLNPQRFLPTRPMSGFRTGDLGMGHMVVYQRSLQDAVRFYCDLLGFCISDFTELPTPMGNRTMVFLHCNPRHHSIAFMETPPLPKRINHFMIECNSLDDVGTAREICQTGSVPITVELGRHHNDRMFSFYMANPSNWWIEYGWDGRLLDVGRHAVEYYQSPKSIWGHPELGRIAAQRMAEAMEPLPRQGTAAPSS
ncbi:MAG TPA: VOC family protein [Dehalococcoidia bacterium]|nr:VOC family protein [Dehalococcoidia bacterium]